MANQKISAGGGGGGGSDDFTWGDAIDKAEETIDKDREEELRDLRRQVDRRSSSGSRSRSDSSSAGSSSGSGSGGGESSSAGSASSRETTGGSEDFSWGDAIEQAEETIDDDRKEELRGLEGQLDQVSTRQSRSRPPDRGGSSRGSRFDRTPVDNDPLGQRHTDNVGVGLFDPFRDDDVERADLTDEQRDQLAQELAEDERRFGPEDFVFGDVDGEIHAFIDPEVQREETLSELRGEVAGEIEGVNFSDVYFVERDGEIKPEITDRGLLRAGAAQSDEFGIGDLETVEVDGQTVVRPIEQEGEEGQGRLESASEWWQSGAEQIGSSVESIVPSGEFTVRTPGMGGGGVPVGSGYQRDVLAGEVTQGIIGAFDPAGNILVAQSAGSWLDEQYVEVGEARSEARDELGDLDLGDLRSDPTGTLAVGLEATSPLPPQHTASELSSGAEVAREAGSAAGQALVEDPIGTSVRAGGIGAASILGPTAALRGGRALAGPARSGGTRIRQAPRSIPDRTPNVRIQRRPDLEGRIAIESGVLRSTRSDIELPDIRSSARLEVQARQAAATERIGGLSSTVTAGPRRFGAGVREIPDRISAEAAAFRSRQQLSDFDLFSRPSVPSLGLRDEVVGTVQGAQLSAEAAAFRVQQRLSSVEPPSLPSTSGLGDEVRGIAQGGALSAEAAAFRARQGLSDLELPSVNTPSRPSLDIRGEVAGTVQGAQLSAEAAAFRARQGLSDLELPSIDTPSRPSLDIRGEVAGTVQGAQLSAEAAAFRARQGLSDLDLPSINTPSRPGPSFRDLDDFTLVVGEPNRPRVDFDVRDAASSEPTRSNPPPAPSSSGGGASGGTVSALMDRPSRTETPSATGQQDSVIGLPLASPPVDTIEESSGMGLFEFDDVGVGGEFGDAQLSMVDLPTVGMETTEPELSPLDTLEGMDEEQDPRQGADVIQRTPPRIGQDEGRRTPGLTVSRTPTRQTTIPRFRTPGAPVRPRPIPIPRFEDTQPAVSDTGRTGAAESVYTDFFDPLSGERLETERSDGPDAEQIFGFDGPRDDDDEFGFGEFDPGAGFEVDFFDPIGGEGIETEPILGRAI